MKRVLLMGINMNVGGTEKALLNMISEMPRNEFEIDILMLEKYGGFLDKLPKDINVKYLEYYTDIKDILNNLPQYTVIKMIKDGKVLNGISLLLIHILTKVIGQRNLFYKCGVTKNAAINNYRKFDKIFVVSEERKNKFVNMMPELKEKTEVFLNIISPKLILKQSEIDEGFKDMYEGLRILTVGRLSDVKGQNLCIEALKKLKDEGYNVKWYCVGDGISRKRYENLVYDNNLMESFIFLGSKTNPYSFMKQCDIYVQSSLHEGYCITLAEAKCFGKPIVTTNFTGAKEQIVNRDTGIIVECNSEDLYKAIKEVIDNVELRNRISKNVTKTLADTSSEINKFLKL